ncbi:fimbrial assembly protein [Actinotalea sp. M2MS4P-6]|uniref:fimbrial assembly protein n=1 Tax=Actinotalea sp. M2MS4P-6 TaxID=2983762 RepID=UPI0021E4D009|nr:fimbrial assembly protein [Actinotalea sp. M2MS4P-6]MCV2394580.1 fimbrial assembly protein [Actinotalea sp. M2MS4P-6]
MSKRSNVADVTTEGAVLDLTGLGAPAHPQVNLLPPDVYSRRGVRRVKVLMGLSLIGVVLLILAGFGFAFLDLGKAESELAAQQAEVERLMAEQAQYAEVPLVKGEIARAEQGRQIATASEVSWFDYFEAIRAVKPEGWAITSISTQMPTANDASLVNPDPLSPAGAGGITFVAEATQIPVIADWVAAAGSITGFDDPRVTAAQIADKDGTAFYQVTVTVVVDEDAFANRFAPEPEADAAAEAAAEEGDN